MRCLACRFVTTLPATTSRVVRRFAADMFGRMRFQTVMYPPISRLLVKSWISIHTRVTRVSQSFRLSRGLQLRELLLNPLDHLLGG